MAIDETWMLKGRKDLGIILRHLASVTEQRYHSSRQDWKSVVARVGVGCMDGGEMMSSV